MKTFISFFAVCARTTIPGIPLSIVVVVACSSVSAADPVPDRIRQQSPQQVSRLVNEAIAQNRIVTHLDVTVSRRRIVYDVSFADNTDGVPWLILVNAPEQKFAAASREYESNGYERRIHRRLRANRETYHAAVWVKPTPAATPLLLPGDPLPMTGESVPGLSALDETMRQFLPGYNVAGATLAVAREGRLVYSRGFGYADIHTRQVMQPDAQMRIASVSKVLTATAIMQLVESGQLRLDAPVLGILEQGNMPMPRKFADPRWAKITVHHLLQHTGGWDRPQTQDPMFQVVNITRELQLKRTATQKDIIRTELSRLLDFDPGSKYAYSNFGYCLLGRVVEAVTGESYADFVGSRILTPCRMTNTTLGRTRIEHRLSQEVRYHMQNAQSYAGFWTVLSTDASDIVSSSVTEPYGRWDLEVMDANGGWVSTGPDLMRFVSALNHPVQPLLSQQSRGILTARPGYDLSRSGSWKACSWHVSHYLPGRYELSHHGALAGTSSLLVNRENGISWAVLFNTDVSNSNIRLSTLIKPVLQRSIRQITDWPDHDLFNDRN